MWEGVRCRRLHCTALHLTEALTETLAEAQSLQVYKI